MRPLHILVLDRDDERRQSLATALRGVGHHAMVTADAQMAAEALTAEPGGVTPGFDTLVLDLSLPGLDFAGLRQAICPEEPAAPDSLEAAERRHIMRALAHTIGNKRQAAHLLGISRSTLHNKIRKYGIASP